MADALRHHRARMDDEARRELEVPIRQACDEERWGEAATFALGIYGGEILGYLAAVTRVDSDAADAFSMFSEDLWRGLPKFRWASSFRTWAYTIARNAAHRLHRDPERRRDKVEIPGSSEYSALAVHIRTTGMLQLRARAEEHVEALRAQLEPDERTLLILRVDRELPWLEIARIMSEEDDPGPETLERSAAALRKRFERTKARLRELANPPQ